MNLHYHSAGKNQTLRFQSIPALAAQPARRRASAKRAAAAVPPGAPPREDSLYRTLSALKSSEFAKLHEAWNNINESDTRYMLTSNGSTLVIATDSLTVEGVSKADVDFLRQKHGFEVVREGLQGKLLLRSRDTNELALKQAEAAIAAVLARAGETASAHPHFVRAVFRPKPSAPGGAPLWNHHNSGAPGIPGADVAAHAAWLITKGHQDIRVAVLDEGVDSSHPALKPAIVAEKDYIDGNSHARPAGNDAHGTACAGIIASQDPARPGLAPRCRLVGVRIAKGDGNDGWISEDFDIADAIDWSWDDARADVISNSWGGGPPVDGIINAIARARTRGRGGKGALVVFAAGNSDGSIDFPGSLDTVMTVGASTPWDERKSPVSRDGESTWGSCYGRSLDLLAPGVRIATTDIAGASGYSSSSDFTDEFNGTSSATPHVAAAAALLLSVNPSLTAQQLHDILTATCDRLSANGKWHKEFGWGRLNIFNALRRALR